MIKRLPHISKLLGWSGIVLGCVSAVCTWPAVGQEEDTANAIVEVSEAKAHFERGVELYNSNLYREALSEFNRAIALEPDLEGAVEFRALCEGKLNITAAGDDPNAVPSFTTIDPEVIQTGPGAPGPRLNAQEVKQERARELLQRAELYLEHKHYSQAVKLFTQVLLIVPNNERAGEGLHEAIIGQGLDRIEATERGIQVDRQRIFEEGRERMRLDAGMDASGIKDVAIRIPIDEEKMPEPEPPSALQIALDAPVSITFEEEHVSNILDFISEYLEINFVLDSRVVAPERSPQQQAGRPGAVGFPGAAPLGGGRANRVGGAGRPSPRDRFVGRRGGGTGRPAGLGGQFGGQGPALQQGGVGGQRVTNGVVPFIKLADVPLKDALQALLRPLNLTYSIQPGFIWVSTADNVRFESFEGLETKIYELRNAGA